MHHNHHWLPSIFLAALSLLFILSPLDSSKAVSQSSQTTPSAYPAPGDSPTRSFSSKQAFIPLVVLAGDNQPPSSTSAILIDHTSTDLSKIPAEWIDKARSLTLHYAHTSHGSQIISGIEWLEKQDPRLKVDVQYASSGPASLPAESGDLRIFDGNPPATYINPEDYWSTTAGLQRTRSVANTGLFDFSMWSWCGQQSSNSTATVQSYLDTLTGLEESFPGMRFILMTGHTDGGSDILKRNNQLVRDYALAHNMVLFDFADIESYDPAGNYYPLTSDSCPWCDNWCSAHPADCANLEQMGDCAHSKALNCKLKGQAFWWMMARLAGWDGQPLNP